MKALHYAPGAADATRARTACGWVVGSGVYWVADPRAMRPDVVAWLDPRMRPCRVCATTADLDARAIPR